jgi:hypothetical protein
MQPTKWLRCINLHIIAVSGVPLYGQPSQQRRCLEPQSTAS